MAERRMFAKTIIDSDAFLDMPVTSQLLYFHLSMRADDEGFINKPKTIMRMIGAKEDDMKILFARKFVIPFESGIVVIKHWKIHNYIRGDRLQQTKYQAEKSLLATDENNAYTMADICQSDVSQLVDKLDTEVRLGKDSIGKDSIDINNIPKSKPEKHKYGEHKNVLLTDDEYEKLVHKYPATYVDKIEEMSEALAIHGYKYKSHYLAILKWAKKDNGRQENRVTEGNVFLSIAREEGML